MSARWLVALRPPLDGYISDPSSEAPLPDRPAPRARGPPDQLGAPRPADGCRSDLVRTITAQSQSRFMEDPSAGFRTPTVILDRRQQTDYNYPRRAQQVLTKRDFGS